MRNSSEQVRAEDDGQTTANTGLTWDQGIDHQPQQVQIILAASSQ